VGAACGSAVVDLGTPSCSEYKYQRWIQHLVVT
jgi:hypothetical protein